METPKPNQQDSLFNEYKELLDETRQVLERNKNGSTWSIYRLKDDKMRFNKKPNLSNSNFHTQYKKEIEKRYQQHFMQMFKYSPEILQADYDKLDYASKAFNSIYDEFSKNDIEYFDLQLDLDIQLKIMQQIITDKRGGGKRLRRRATRAKRRQSKNKSRRHWNKKVRNLTRHRR